MSAALAWLLSDPTVLAVFGGVVAALVAFMKGRTSGAAKERARQAEAEAKARTIADEVDNDVGAMPPDEARKELGTWVR